MDAPYDKARARNGKAGARSGGFRTLKAGAAPVALRDAVPESAFCFAGGIDEVLSPPPGS